MSSTKDITIKLVLGHNRVTAIEFDDGTIIPIGDFGDRKEWLRQARR